MPPADTAHAPSVEWAVDGALLARFAQRRVARPRARRGRRRRGRRRRRRRAHRVDRLARARRRRLHRLVGRRAHPWLTCDVAACVTCSFTDWNSCPSCAWLLIDMSPTTIPATICLFIRLAPLLIKIETGAPARARCSPTHRPAARGARRRPRAPRAHADATAHAAEARHLPVLNGAKKIDGISSGKPTALVGRRSRMSTLKSYVF